MRGHHLQASSSSTRPTSMFWFQGAPLQASRPCTASHPHSLQAACPSPLPRLWGQEPRRAVIHISGARELTFPSCNYTFLPWHLRKHLFIKAGKLKAYGIVGNECIFSTLPSPPLIARTLVIALAPVAWTEAGRLRVRLRGHCEGDPWCSENLVKPTGI